MSSPPWAEARVPRGSHVDVGGCRGSAAEAGLEEEPRVGCGSPALCTCVKMQSILVTLSNQNRIVPKGVFLAWSSSFRKYWKHSCLSDIQRIKCFPLWVSRVGECSDHSGLACVFNPSIFFFNNVRNVYTVYSVMIISIPEYYLTVIFPFIVEYRRVSVPGMGCHDLVWPRGATGVPARAPSVWTRPSAHACLDFPSFVFTVADRQKRLVCHSPIWNWGNVHHGIS